MKKAYGKLYRIDLIRWDIANTKAGPVIIEGDDNWKISIMQINKG